MKTTKVSIRAHADHVGAAKRIAHAIRAVDRNPHLFDHPARMAEHARADAVVAAIVSASARAFDRLEAGLLGLGSLLHDAAMRDLPRTAEALIDGGCGVTAIGDQGHTPAVLAASVGSIATLDVLLRRGSAVPVIGDVQPHCVHEPLALAMIEHLIEAGAAPGTRVDALCEAAFTGQDQTVRALMSAGLRPDLPHPSGWPTPLAAVLSMTQRNPPHEGLGQRMRALAAIHADPRSAAGVHILRGREPAMLRETTDLLARGDVRMRIHAAVLGRDDCWPDRLGPEDRAWTMDVVTACALVGPVPLRLLAFVSA